MLFFCGSLKVDERYVDVSQQAILTDHVPFSVGVRSQAMKIRFVAPDSAGRFLKPAIDHQMIFGDLDKRFGRNLARPILHQAHIGETISMIYAPFYVDDTVYDAILNKPLTGAEGPDFDPEQWKGGAPKWPPNFLATLCPHCGAEIYEETEQCPACGDYVTFSTNVWSGRPAWWIVLALTGLVAAVLVMAGLIR